MTQKMRRAELVRGQHKKNGKCDWPQLKKKKIQRKFHSKVGKPVPVFK